MAKHSALRRFVVAVLGGTIVACSAPPPQAVPEASPGVAARIARAEADLRPDRPSGTERGPYTIEQRMRQYAVPGLSIAVVNENRVEWARGYGVLEAGRDARVTTETLFQAASMSKPIAALAALQLVERGRIGLDEDVAGRLSSWRGAASPITLRGLLTHTAGLGVHGFPGYAAGEPLPSLAQILNGTRPANTGRVRREAEAGTVQRYSGGGYTVMELLLEQLENEPFDALAERLVLRPVGMRRSTFTQPLPDSLHPRAAVAHDLHGRPLPGRWHTYPERAAAGLWSTPGDLARYVVELNRAYAGAESAALDPLIARAILTHNGFGFGLGPMVRGEGDELHFEHGGSNVGYKGLLLGLPTRGQGVVVMANGEGAIPLIEELVGAIAREYGWPGS